MKENLVVQSNALIEASYNLTLDEQRLLMQAVSKVDSRETIDEWKKITISVPEMRDLFYQEADRKAPYNAMKRASHGLFKKEIRIHLDENRELLTRFIQQMIWDNESKEIHIWFADSMKPYLTALKNHFTEYKLKNIVHLKSAYAIRFYQFLCEWQGIGKNMEIMAWEKLNELLASSYKNFGHFKAKVLDVAIEQINIYTDFQVAYALKKTGRRVSHIQFQWEIKNKPESIAQRKIENTIAKTRRLQSELQQAQQELSEQAMSELNKLPRGTMFIDEKDCIYTIEATNPLLIYTTDKDGHKFYVSNTEKFAREWFLDGKLQLHFVD